MTRKRRKSGQKRKRIKPKGRRREQHRGIEKIKTETAKCDICKDRVRKADLQKCEECDKRVLCAKCITEERKHGCYDEDEEPKTLDFDQDDDFREAFEDDRSDESCYDVDNTSDWDY